MASQMTFRAWQPAERRVVLRGTLGRMTIVIEPLVLGLFFITLAIVLLARGQEIGHLVAPIFTLAAIAFVAYAIVLMTPAVRAMIATFTPIYTVNGYLRYRQSRPSPDAMPEYYVAVLDGDRQVLGEWRLQAWPAHGGEESLWPAVVEFSRYGGIHKIDGRPTGVLPADITPLGIDIAHDAERRSLQFE